MYCLLTGNVVWMAQSLDDRELASSNRRDIISHITTSTLDEYIRTIKNDKEQHQTRIIDDWMQDHAGELVEDIAIALETKMKERHRK